MKKSLRIGLVCLLLAACGQSGPLYLPPGGEQTPAGESASDAG